MNFSLPRWKKLLIPFQSQLRRSHRLFKKFPAGSYRAILDVGAHQGEFSTPCLNYFQPDKVWLVEADPELAAHLQARFAPDPRCRVIQAAIANFNGAAEFRINEHRPSSSLLPIEPVSEQLFQKSMRETKVIRVPALTLDQLFNQEKIERVDLLKIDIQGGEKGLLQAASDSLPKVQFVYIEVLFETVYEGCALFPEIHDLMRGHSFKLCSFHDFRKSPAGFLVYSNALYANTRELGAQA